MLADDKLVSQEIAVLRLKDISKKNKIYDDTIKLFYQKNESSLKEAKEAKEAVAFIKRMKAPYKEAKEANQIP